MSHEAHDVSSRSSARRAAQQRARWLLSLTHQEPDDITLVAGTPRRWRWAMLVYTRRAWRSLRHRYGPGLLDARTEATQ